MNPPLSRRRKAIVVVIAGPIVGAVIALVLKLTSPGSDAQALIVIGIAALAAAILVPWSGIASHD